MELRCKWASLEDIDVLTKLRIEVLRAANHLGDSVDMTEVERQSYAYYSQALADDTHIAYLTFDGTVPVGSGGASLFRVLPTFHNPSGNQAYIMNMYTAPAYRRRGIAYRTLDHLVQEVRRRGISFISLEATDMGRPLYQKYGFAAMENEMQLPSQP